MRELAGLPGLLARVDPDVLESAPHVEPVPETLLPALVQRGTTHTAASQVRSPLGWRLLPRWPSAVGSLAVTGVLGR